MSGEQVQALRFFSGEDNGSLKVIECRMNNGECSVTENTISSGTSRAGISRLSTFRRGESRLLAVARYDATISVMKVDVDVEEPAQMVLEIKEDRVKAPVQFVGLNTSEYGVYSCTSVGHLRFTPLEQEGESSGGASRVAYLPPHLREVRLSPSKKSLAYGGDEVQLSLWDLERALDSKAADLTASETPGKKRKKSKTLLPGEQWRAQNEPNDFLDLRQPIRITSLAYLSEERLITGNHDGTLRLFDTRLGRRSAANWKNVLKESIRSVEPGVSEHQIFAGDVFGNLSAIDSRTGRIIYSYKGISGGITAITASPPYMASLSRDRFFRLHSAPPPEGKAGANQSKRGGILAEHYLPSVPTALVWCKDSALLLPARDEESGDEEVWEGMEQAGDDDGSDDAGPRKRQKAVDRLDA